AVWNAMSVAESLDLTTMVLGWHTVLEEPVRDDPRTPFTLVRTDEEILLLDAFLAGRRAGLEGMPGLPAE
nr:hypothetical protein [Deltaproteobacteria bacterium]